MGFKPTTSAIPVQCSPSSSHMRAAVCVLRPMHTRELPPAARSCHTLPQRSSFVCTDDFWRKNMLRNKTFAPEFCSIKLVWYEGASSGGKFLARVCFRSKLPRMYWNLLAVTRRVSSWRIKLAYFCSSHAPIGLFYHSAPSSCPSCVLVGALIRERVSGACFRSKLPRVYRPLGLYVNVILGQSTWTRVIF